MTGPKKIELSLEDERDLYRETLIRIAARPNYPAKTLADAALLGYVAGDCVQEGWTPYKGPQELLRNA